MKKIKDLEVNQKTPLRVLHRRSNKIRKRIVRRVDFKILTKKKMEIIIRAQAGLYIKEFINGDNNRTNPSISQILGNEPKKISLDVIKIHSKKYGKKI